MGAEHERADDWSAVGASVCRGAAGFGDGEGAEGEGGGRGGFDSSGSDDAAGAGWKANVVRLP